MSIISRFQKGWNTFIGRDPTKYRPDYSYGSTYYYRPDRPVLTMGNERSIINAVYNRIAVDVASVKILHVNVDENGKFLSERSSGLNNCLSVEANLDQTGRDFIMDIVLSMIDEGTVAVVPIDTDLNPDMTSGYDILTMRTGRILEWLPDKVKVRLYNEKDSRKYELYVPKHTCAIITNPFYSVMNEPNSTLQRLIRKLNLLDSIDEQNSSGKLDLIIQLPYVIKTAARRVEAEKRRSEIEQQLTNGKYGIAYTDGTERITQLNRPVENNLQAQIESLTNLLYSQLGITQAILDGSADENVMQNYYTRTIEPILSAITDEFKRKFLTKTARSQNQSIMFFRDPFKLVPVTKIADIADKFTRNEILSSNELRGIIGYKPSSDPRADELRNKNINKSADAQAPPKVGANAESEEGLTDDELKELDDLDKLLDER